MDGRRSVSNRRIMDGRGEKRHSTRGGVESGRFADRFNSFSPRSSLNRLCLVGGRLLERYHGGREGGGGGYSWPFIRGSARDRPAWPHLIIHSD